MPANATMTQPESAHFEALLSDLTDAQRAAVEHTEGPLLILAAAGSGKTRVITRRIAYLLGLGVPAWQVLALTFTNKAAGEMRERVGSLLRAHPEGDRLERGLTVTTFHSLCARLLRRYAPLMEGAPGWAIRHDYTIYDSDDQMSLMKRVIKELDLNTSNWSPRSVLSAISASKNELKEAEAYEREASDFYSRTIARIFLAYERALRAANAVDFDDLLLLTVRLLKESAEARAEVQARWRYLMIDEYQDTNRAQFILSTLLCGHDEGAQPNVCVVGDPDQSIYGWRGADIGNILDFEEQYPGTKVISLGQNFRSTSPILGVADALIRNNVKRKHKELFTTREGGAAPEVTLCRDEHHEAQLVVDWFRARHKSDAQVAEGEGFEWKDMAVFYRNNALSRVMEEEFRRAGIPYVIARGTAFYQREEVKDAVAYLRVVANTADDVSLRRIINKPARKIGKATIEKADQHAAGGEMTLFEALRDAGRIPGLAPAAVNAVERFVQMVDGWNGAGTFMGAEVSASLAELVSRVIAESGLEAHYQKAARKNEEDAQKLDNLQELVSSAADFAENFDPSVDLVLGEAGGESGEEPGGDDDTPPLLALLRAYLESISLVADADAIDPASGAVTLMTLHAAKGLEFPAVAIVGLEDGLLPAERSLHDPDQLEEERRLLFVGITRAMSELHISSAKYRTHRGLRERTIPSRFLSELPEEMVRLSDQSETWSPDEAWDGEGWSAAAGEAGELRYEPDMSEMGESGELTKGCVVRHPRFGVGKVVSVSSRGMNARAAIDFRDVGRKTLVLRYAGLEILSGA